ncbi:hypothetical protein B0T19DRAFT_448870 [Cercophora scortea]|uniref:T6SS Phospholipase effector Tle1-like catalytic domain-containing protein n=1 Tax=Cercophora scortea TaxID=314031 RepID=A0AAE0IY83_9PEZI|nr:hypothetical protein B0T19DRAFT_448870 [Cercophora scortea]
MNSFWPARKRLIICCDGTWMDSDTGYTKPSYMNPAGKAQTPSNVTRISRSLKRICSDGRLQIIEYHCGVGSSGTISDLISGGAFGLGISENIRASYAFICANYCDGDEIIIIGFSRGAFTARSIAGMVSDIGLLTRAGMDYFYPIYKDTQNWRTLDYQDPFPTIPFDNKPKGENAAPKYRQILVERGLTRINENAGNGTMIKVKAVAVWDTVGSLGIPNVGWLARLGLPHSTKEYRFFDTSLSDRIEHAFHALALDEHRKPFSPTLWERTAANKGTTDLRQVWFPGNHGNVGGGWQDAGMANISLAWMMDQLASIGVEFDEATIVRVFTQLERSYRDMPNPDNHICGVRFSKTSPSTRHWAIEPICESNVPIRPWGLGGLRASKGTLSKLVGYDLRCPGTYKKLDPATGDRTRAFLEDTHERIHSSVRVRLSVEGLGLNDVHVWEAPALKGNWRLRKTSERFVDPISATVATWEPAMTAQIAKTLVAYAIDQQRPLSVLQGKKERWVWEWCGPEKDAPPERVLVEEPLGPYERQLLRLSGGVPNVYEFAEGVKVRDEDA